MNILFNRKLEESNNYQELADFLSAVEEFIAEEVTVLVTGGRKYDNEVKAKGILDVIASIFTIDKIVQGGCPTGADFIARDYAYTREYICQTYKADWKKLGKKAGPIRNQTMFDLEKPHIVVAFPGGRGTQSTVNIAKNTECILIEVK